MAGLVYMCNNALDLRIGRILQGNEDCTAYKSCCHDGLVVALQHNVGKMKVPGTADLACKRLCLMVCEERRTDGASSNFEDGIFHFRLACEAINNIVRTLSE